MSSVLEQTASAAAAALARKAEAQRHIDLGPAFHDDLTSYRGPSIAFGIVLAGGAYPLVLGLIALVVVGMTFLWTLITYGIGSDLAMVASLPLAIMVYAGFSSVVGAVWAAIVSLFTLPVVYLFIRSLKLKGSIIWLGAVSGGLVGFLAVLPVTLSLPLVTSTPDDHWWLALMLLAGPGLTTILGQLGGAWGGQRAAQYAVATQWKAALAEAGRWQATGQDSAAAAPGDAEEEPRLQFRIRHMLWIFVWFSLLLSVIRLSGIPFQYVLPLLVGWLLYQSATLYVGSLFFHWRNARSAESRQPFHVEPLAK